MPHDLDSQPPLLTAEETVAPRRHPLLGIWIQPRATIRNLLADGSPARALILFAPLAGIAQSAARAADRGFGTSLPLPLIVLIVVLVGSIGGVVWWLLLSF